MPLFHVVLSAAAAIAAAATTPVAAGRANRAATNGAATKVPTSAADSWVRTTSAATQTAEEREPGEQPDQVIGRSPGPPGVPLAQSAESPSHSLPLNPGAMERRRRFQCTGRSRG